jgi:predicted nuclease of predicted toxin-antitoxin system
MGQKPIPFFTDQNVPDSVGNFLKSAGHTVARLRDCMPTDTSDKVVGVACIVNGSVLVTHDNDFRQVAKRLQISQRQYRRLHRIILRCREPNGASRLKVALSSARIDETDTKTA